MQAIVQTCDVNEVGDYQKALIYANKKLLKLRRVAGIFLVLMVFCFGCSAPSTPQSRFRANREKYVEAIQYLLEAHHREVAMRPFLEYNE